MYLCTKNKCNVIKYIMKFKETLEKYGLTQTDLANRLGINRVSVSRLLSDKNDLRFSTIEKIAAAIGCEVTELFTNSKRPTAPTNSDFTALVKSGQSYYSASTLEELKAIVTDLEKQEATGK